MARDETQREDLLHEAIALVQRVEIVPSSPIKRCADEMPMASIVAGFRANGALSLFFGEDPVFQFNASGELRRAYAKGQLVKAVHGRLIMLDRVRTTHAVELRQIDLNLDDESAFVSEIAGRIRRLSKILDSGGYVIRGQVPLDADVIGRLKIWLSTNEEPRIAQRPNA